jgi:hypothetical protein
MSDGADDDREAGHPRRLDGDDPDTGRQLVEVSAKEAQPRLRPARG